MLDFKKYLSGRILNEDLELMFDPEVGAKPTNIRDVVRECATSSSIYILAQSLNVNHRKIIAVTVHCANHFFKGNVPSEYVKYLNLFSDYSMDGSKVSISKYKNAASDLYFTLNECRKVSDKIGADLYNLVKNESIKFEVSINLNTMYGRFVADLYKAASLLHPHNNVANALYRSSIGLDEHQFIYDTNLDIKSIAEEFLVDIIEDAFNKSVKN